MLADGGHRDRQAPALLARALRAMISPGSRSVAAGDVRAVKRHLLIQGAAERLDHVTLDLVPEPVGIELGLQLQPASFPAAGAPTAATSLPTPRFG